VSFVLTKIVLYLIVPPASLLILMAFGFLIVRFRPFSGRLLIAAGFVSLYLLSINPVSDALIGSLETRIPPLKDEKVRADAIVVLGGGVSDLSWAGLRPEPSSPALGRLVKGIVLHRSLRLPLVLVGGNGDPSRVVTADANAMEAAALDLGVRPKDLLLENKSRNTLEGAKTLGEVIRGRRIILVTAAYHMERSAGMFRKQGFEVIPAPTAYLKEKRNITWYSLIPQARSLYVSSAACSEYISLAFYRLIKAL